MCVPYVFLTLRYIRCLLVNCCTIAHYGFVGCVNDNEYESEFRHMLYTYTVGGTGKKGYTAFLKTCVRTVYVP